MSAIELADYRALARQAHRTKVVTVVVCAIALLLAAAAFLVAPRQGQRGAALLPRGASGIVVVDVSASISSDTYARIAATLNRLQRGGGRAGLILFSDTAYQALPPGTPVKELGSFERFFRVAPPTQPGLQPQPPRSPWTSSFSAGTRISTGLSLALDVAQQDRLHKPVVLLVSDLDDDAGDLESLTSVGLAYRKLGIPINVVGLNPSPEDTRYIARLLPSGGRIERAALPEQRSVASRTGFPTALALLAVALAAVLGGVLLITARLRWRPA